jgi:hypothetical protein
VALWLIAALFFLPPQEARASLNFTGTGGNNVNHGSDTSLDNLTNLTYLIWIKPNATGQAAGLIAKGVSTGGGSRRSLELRNITANAIYGTVDLSTTDAAAESTANAYNANEWTFIGMTYNDTAKVIKLYSGTLTSPVAEVSYSSTVTGSGTTGSNASNNQFVAAYGSGTSGNPNAAISWAAIWNRVLTLDEIKQHQFRPFCNRADGCVLFTEYGWAGTGTQADFSGNGNNGTVTGATVTDHAPIARHP